MPGPRTGSSPRRPPGPPRRRGAALPGPARCHAGPRPRIRAPRWRCRRRCGDSSGAGPGRWRWGWGGSLERRWPAGPPGGSAPRPGPGRGQPGPRCRWRPRPAGPHPDRGLFRHGTHRLSCNLSWSYYSGAVAVCKDARAARPQNAGRHAPMPVDTRRSLRHTIRRPGAARGRARPSMPWPASRRWRETCPWHCPMRSVAWSWARTIWRPGR